jgi:hypothetical protein
VVIGLIPFLGAVILCITGIPMLIVDFVILGWAGFKAVKEGGLDILGGAVAGLIAGLISSVVVGVISFVLGLLGIAVGTATGGDMGTAVLGGGFAIVGLIIGICWGSGLGLVAGAIGALVAGKK